MKKYTKTQKAKLKEMAKIYRLAKEKLWNGRGRLDDEQMICYAISSVTGWDYTPNSPADRCRQLVMIAIEPCMRMDSWYHAQHGRWPSPREVQEVRHAFLDKLIEECENASR